MPTFSRKTLRRDLARGFIHDMPFEPISGVYGTTPTVNKMQNYAFPLANTDFSGQGLYVNTWMYQEGSTNQGDTAPTFMQYLVGSYNPGSGAFISGQQAMDAWRPGVSIFEIHTRISPLDKHQAIDDTITRLRMRQEVPIWTVDGARFYAIDGAASPYTIDRILNVHVAADPANSLNPDIRTIPDWDTVLTGSGNLLRLSTGIGGSQQLLIDAILIPTLSGELGTINLPSERWVLAGAAMRCYDYMIQAAPAQQVGQLEKRRAEFANEFSRLSSRHQPSYDHDVKLHDITRGPGGVTWQDPLW